MKLKSLFLLLILAVCGLVGCSTGNNDSKKINFSIGDKTVTDFIEVGEEKIEQMIESEESFIVYVYSNTCGSCVEVTPIVKEIIVEYGITVYKTIYQSLSSSSPLKLSGTPIIGFYKNGAKLKIIGYTEKTRDQLNNKAGLLKLFKEYVILPQNAFYISAEELRRKKAAKETFTIIFSRRTCPDCTFMSTAFLDNYILSNLNKQIFFIECDVIGIRFNEENIYDNDQWVAFKNEFGLSEEYSSEHGYGVGYVPTIQRYTLGELSDSAVYLNDDYDEVEISSDDKKSTYEYTIKTSFYSDFVGQTFRRTFTRSESLASDIYVNYRLGALEFHNAKLTAFLSKY